MASRRAVRMLTKLKNAERSAIKKEPSYYIRAVLIKQLFFQIFFFFFPSKAGKTGNVSKVWKINRLKCLECFSFQYLGENMENMEIKMIARKKLGLQYYSTSIGIVLVLESLNHNPLLSGQVVVTCSLHVFSLPPHLGCFELTTFSTLRLTQTAFFFVLKFLIFLLFFRAFLFCSSRFS